MDKLQQIENLFKEKTSVNNLRPVTHQEIKNLYESYRQEYAAQLKRVAAEIETAKDLAELAQLETDLDYLRNKIHLLQRMLYKATF